MYVCIYIYISYIYIYHIYIYSFIGGFQVLCLSPGGLPWFEPGGLLATRTVGSS